MQKAVTINTEKAMNFTIETTDKKPKLLKITLIDLLEAAQNKGVDTVNNVITMKGQSCALDTLTATKK